MQLCRTYFEEYGRPMMKNQFQPYFHQMAAGLVGQGSECLGFDDEISQDHDFGPGFCIWLPQDLYEKIGADLQKAYDSLPGEWHGIRRMETPQGGGRVGVLSIEEFYLRYTGLTKAPEDHLEWFRIPQSFLSVAANGQVFCDNLGEFTKIRETLQQFYPQDVLKKKLAAKMAVLAQSGQYNYPRCMKRGDSGAAYLACSEFIKTALSAIYLLNQQYMPFYKWAFRGAQEFKILPEAVTKLQQLVLMTDQECNRSQKETLIEEICIEIGQELNRRGYTQTKDSFLQSHGEELMAGIEDPRLKNMHIMIDQD